MIYTIDNGYQILIDNEDLEKIKKYRWRVDKSTGYIYSDFLGKKIYLHRYIMDVHNEQGTGLVIDHINRDIRDNRKENLRIVTHAQNLRNLSILSNSNTGYRNIYKKGHKFCLMSNYDGRVTYFGTYSSIQEALNAKVNIWRDLWGLDIRTDVLKATMEKWGLNKDIQEYIIEGLNEVV
jgi:hypothetical protein